MTRNLSHSRIPYVLNPDGSPGYIWGIVTGCGQPPEVCATWSKCWARLENHCFGATSWSKLYTTDFSPKFNEHLLDVLFRLRKPSMIAVAFTGDLFGPGSHWSWQERILGRVWQLPQHNFLFLTKSPENLARLNPWPNNAWVGTTITGAETPERQQAMMADLCKVEGGKRWVSYEPMLGPFLMSAFMVNLDFLVLGAQSGPRAVKPRLEWIQTIIAAAAKAGIPLWLKDNLLKQFPELPRRQERP